MPKPKAFDPLALPESNATSYPEPYRAENQRRWNRRLGDHAGLKNFGVNLTRIVPGGQSSSRHWHSRQDEFVYVLSGEVVLETDGGEEILRPGMCVGFPAGIHDGHRFLNRSKSTSCSLSSATAHRVTRPAIPTSTCTAAWDRTA